MLGILDVISYFKLFFSNYHNVPSNELCCSMDYINVMFDYKNKKESWLHRDQAWWLYNGNTLSLQGFYSRYSVDKDDSGFVCVPYSHKLDYQKTSTKTHYVVLDKNSDLHNYSVKILIPENSFIVFNSKTLHCNQSGSRNLQGTIENIPLLNRLGACIILAEKFKK